MGNSIWLDEDYAEAVYVYKDERGCLNIGDHFYTQSEVIKLKKFIEENFSDNP